MDSECVKDIANIAREGAAAQVNSVRVDNSAYVQVLSFPKPNGGIELKSVKPFIDEWAAAPDRRAGIATAMTLQSLIDLTNRHKDEDSVLFANLGASGANISAIFDYHKIDGAPRFGKHRAVYSFPLSEEWKAWQASNGREMKQSEWAAFIEDRIADLAAPSDDESKEFESLFQTKIATPAEMITLSRGMQISVEGKVKEARNLTSGEAEIIFEEVHKDGSGQKLVVPGLFIINIPLFVDAAYTRLIARLRYRRREQSIIWFYQLYRAADMVREAMRQDAAHVAKETVLPLFEGSAEVEVK